jgi:hypothetical protein
VNKQYKIIYIICPAQTLTGGPEAVHQCVDVLRRSGADARIVYVPEMPDPTQLAYAHYDTRYARRVEDRPENLIMAPETLTWKMKGYRHIQRAVWWLSVDNQFKLPAERMFDWQEPANHSVRHFAQSCYAADYLRQQGVEQPMLLTDYLQAQYIQPLTDVPRLDQVVYFEKKNLDVIDQLKAADPDIRWVPIANMTPLEVRLELARSKVYVDFGPHPGRDRMPREAAMQGCCVLVGNRGAAAFDGDYPFPAAYKFDQQEGNWSAVTHVIRSCLADFGRHHAAFDGYRDWIRGQERAYQREVIAGFGCGDGVREVRAWIKWANYSRFYRNKVIKKLSGYQYHEDDE